MPDRTLHHFAAFRFPAAWWGAETETREAAWQEIASALAAMRRAELYRAFPARAEADLIVWTAAELESGRHVATRLAEIGEALRPLRRFAEPVGMLWGVTRPSQYVGKPSERSIDALSGARRSCVVVYPFAKTPEWYLLEPDDRRRLMGAHIRIGREFREIDQLLLYSHGLGDQEFVVVYETEDLGRFSELVEALRSTEVRRYTSKDTPVWVGLHVPREQATATW